VTTLEDFRKQAKRWLKEIRRGNPGPLRRLRRAWPQAPAEPGLRDIQHALARENGYDSWTSMKRALELQESRPGDAGAMDDHAGRVGTFLELACWDHRVHGRSDHAMRESAAGNLLRKHPEISRDSLYTAVVCGDLEHVRHVLADRPELASRKGGSRRWEPLLYLTYGRLPTQAARDNAVAIARVLLDHGADPNAYYMAGDAFYSVLVGVPGEGEQDAPPHPQREALYRLLLERGADPFDIQVLYNTHFRGDVLWWLELTYAHTLHAGPTRDWDDPDWPMLDMGGYGSGARFLLWIAIEKNNPALARWLLAHGANPNAASPRAPSLSKRSLYEEAVRAGRDDIAAMLLRAGAAPVQPALTADEAFVVACLHVDRAAARALLDQHPEFLRSPRALFAAVKTDDTDVVTFVLDLGTRIDVEDEQGQQALHIAAASDARRAAAVLIERGADVNGRETQWKATPLGYAAHHGHQAMIDLLAPVSSDVWNLTNLGKNERLREVLAANPESAREVTEDGMTPLWWLPIDDARAAEAVDLLVAAGADPTIKSKDGQTPADRARDRGLDAAAARLAIRP
jgi:uncharacterized protein